MSHLAGPSGKVTGIEVDTGLATRAKKNLSSYCNVRIVTWTALPITSAGRFSRLWGLWA
jgi:protein-L-isoaspartate O-methyltransferase